MRFFSKQGMLALLLAVSGLFGQQVLAAGEAEVRAHLDALSANTQGAFSVDTIEPAGMKNIYKVQLGNGDLVHVSPSEDGRYLLIGSLLELKDGELSNVTEQELQARQQAARVGLLGELKAADAIVFAPEGEVKGTLHVFTDISCGFCRKLHQEVPELNRMGIEVRYLAFPRGGERSQTFAAMQSIWCSKDQQHAMTQAKQGQAVAPQTCASDAVSDQYRLGSKMGVNGTPAIFLDDGRLIPGYRDAQTFAKMLGL